MPVDQVVFELELIVGVVSLDRSLLVFPRSLGQY